MDLQKVDEEEFHVGFWKIPKPEFKALLIFHKESTFTRLLQFVLTRLGFSHQLENYSEKVLTELNESGHHLVFLDCTHYDEAKSLCRSMRASEHGRFSTIVAVVRRNQTEVVSAIREFLKIGFDRIMHETVNSDELSNEILQLEVGHLSHQIRIRSCRALFTALERSRDSVLITDNQHRIQYMNKTHGQLTGFESNQVIGKKFSHYIGKERNEDDIWGRILEELKDGNEWDGCLYVKSRYGEDVQLQVLIFPFEVQDRSAQQYVVVSRLPNVSACPQTGIKPKAREHHRPSSANEQATGRRLSTSSSYEGDAPHRRTNSLAKIHSMAIEAPITQIINLINVAKENSQHGVNEVLDQILEILRNSELYAPADLQTRARDPMLTDFVEGLVTGSGFSHRRSSGGDNLVGRAFSSDGLTRRPSNTPGGYVATMVDPKVALYLENSESWDYDVLALEQITFKKPLVHLGMRILNQFKACDVLCCSANTLHAWLVAMETNYHACNTYHNSTHAADVLQATAYFLQKQRLKMWMEPMDEVASLLAAIIHDVDHPGRTNGFLINSNDQLALLYNDTAVLESHHAAFAFKFTVNNEKCNIFKSLSRDDFMIIRQSIVDMVLATELSKHFEHVNKFISIVTKNSSITADQEGTPAPSSRGSVGQSVVTHELKTLIKRVMIKVADVINPARKTPICVEWARRISEEYFSQTDEEKRLKLPVVMPHFDRNTCSMPKSQMTFIDYFLTDMCEAWHEFCGMDEVMDNLHYNYDYWRKLQDRGIMRLAELEDEKNSDLDFSTITP